VVRPYCGNPSDGGETEELGLGYGPAR